MFPLVLLDWNFPAISFYFSQLQSPDQSQLHDSNWLSSYPLFAAAVESQEHLGKTASPTNRLDDDGEKEMRLFFQGLEG